MATEQKCRTCGAPVVFLRHIRTGKVAPIETTPSPDGDVAVGAQYMIVPALQRDAYRARGELLYKNHYATCPQARFWHAESRQSRQEVRD